MTIEYIPASGFIIDSFAINWSDPREMIREKLNQKHKNDDKVIDLAQYFNGDESNNIHQFRDIYTNYNAGENYFFLSYSKEGLLTELEIHWGVKIKIHQQVLEFNAPIEIALEKLFAYDNSIRETDEGHYLIPKLNLSIATAEAMGSDGNGLSYFYAGKNINHLLKE